MHWYWRADPVLWGGEFLIFCYFESLKCEFWHKYMHKPQLTSSIYSSHSVLIGICNMCMYTCITWPNMYHSIVVEQPSLINRHRITWMGAKIQYIWLTITWKTTHCSLYVKKYTLITLLWHMFGYIIHVYIHILHIPIRTEWEE